MYLNIIIQCLHLRTGCVYFSLCRSLPQAQELRFLCPQQNWKPSGCNSGKGHTANYVPLSPYLPGVSARLALPVPLGRQLRTHSELSSREEQRSLILVCLSHLFLEAALISFSRLLNDLTPKACDKLGCAGSDGAGLKLKIKKLWGNTNQMLKLLCFFYFGLKNRFKTIAQKSKLSVFKSVSRIKD